MRADRVLELVGGDQARTLRRRTAHEEHDAAARVGVGGLEQTNGHAEGSAGRAERALVAGNWPWVTLELLDNVSERHVAVLHGLEKLVGAEILAGLALVAHSRCSSTGGQLKQVLDVLGGKLLGAAEDVALGASLTAQLVELDCSAERDQANKRVGRKKAERHDKRLLERLEILLVHAQVHNKEKHGWDGRLARQSVLNGRELVNELGGKVGLGDALVVGREHVPLLAKDADPELGADVDGAKGVENGSALVALDGLVADGRQVGALLERRKERRDRHNQAGGLDAGGGDDIPAEADAVRVLAGVDKLLVRRHPAALHQSAHCSTQDAHS
eukprot:m.8300 g.8300  ORF g.8300 m.8300 type:complete len:330 (+) comp2844_c0_seq1:1736-2725(+)